MPYVSAGNQQKTSTLPDVKDIFHSSTVYINDVPAGLWLSEKASAGFAGVNISDVPSYSSEYTESLSTLTTTYVASPNTYYNQSAEESGVKANYPGTIDLDASSILTIDGKTDATTATSETTEISIFLDQILEEASRGLWRESGQGGGKSNSNIVGPGTPSTNPNKGSMKNQGIWPNLGFDGTVSPWKSDQTAWCAGFVNFVLKLTGHKYVQTASAKLIHTNPEKWGATAVTDRSTAQPGDIVVWTFSHVNFVYSNINGKLSFCGGNQTPTSGQNNNPSDGDVTISYKNGCPPTHPNILSIWRPALVT